MVLAAKAQASGETRRQHRELSVLLRLDEREVTYLQLGFEIGFLVTLATAIFTTNQFYANDKGLIYIGFIIGFLCTVAFAIIATYHYCMNRELYLLFPAIYLWIGSSTAGLVLALELPFYMQIHMLIFFSFFAYRIGWLLISVTLMILKSADLIGIPGTVLEDVHAPELYFYAWVWLSLHLLYMIRLSSVIIIYYRYIRDRQILIEANRPAAYYRDPATDESAV
ncbi:unnamed protein product, partial [Mesorhabditis spiculigera]